ncbi:MAG: DUF3168 domain-containing protein [Loktanella sp.]|nr:DUF3168 domain-containing protein [Loktanella sp.]
MTYAIAAALQSAIYRRLTADPALTALIGTAIYDALPAGPVPPLYLLLGGEEVRDASDQTGQGADHALTITLHSQDSGFAAAKQAAAAVCDALLDAALPLTRGTLVGLHFSKARAARKDGARRITLTFRARVADDT